MSAYQGNASSSQAKAVKNVEAHELESLVSETLFEGRFLRVKRKERWEYVERCKTSSIVAILAITERQELILIEQFRVPVGRRVIEIPAGLAGDIEGKENESLTAAAKRELSEETGYEAQRMEYLTEGPSSAGLSTEVISFFRAAELEKVCKGGGDATAAALSARAEQLQSFYLSYEKIRPSIDPPQPCWIAVNRQRRPLRVPHYNRCNRQEPFGDADGAPAVVRAEPVLRKTNPTSSQFIPMSHQH